MPSTGGPDVDNSSAIVQLKGDPRRTSPSTKPPHGRKIDFKEQWREIVSCSVECFNGTNSNGGCEQMPPEQRLRAITSSTYAVAVQLNGTSLATFATAPMVQSAEYNRLYYPNLSQSYKIINASNAWTAAGGRATRVRALRSAISTGASRRRTLLRSNRVQLHRDSKCDAADSNSHHKDKTAGTSLQK